MVATLGIRTIWITLRAVNYASQALRTAMADIDKLRASELSLNAAQLRLATQTLAASMMFATLGMSLMQAGWEMAKTTETFKPLVRLFEGFGKLSPEVNEGLRTFVSLLLMAGGAAMTLASLVYVIKSVQTLIPFLKQLNGELLKTTAASMAAFAVFMLTYSILSKLNNPIVSLIVMLGALAAALWAVFVAHVAASSGLSLIPAGIAVGAALALANQSGLQMGTRMVERTGPVVAHKGEIVYNPATHRPTQVGNDLEEGGVRTNIFDISVPIENVHTTSDFDDLDEKLRKSLGKLARNRR